MKKIKIPYGNKEIEFSIPENNFSELLIPNSPQLPESGKWETMHALEEPIGVTIIVPKVTISPFFILAANSILDQTLI